MWSNWESHEITTAFTSWAARPFVRLSLLLLNTGIILSLFLLKMVNEKVAISASRCLLKVAICGCHIYTLAFTRDILVVQCILLKKTSKKFGFTSKKTRDSTRTRYVLYMTLLFGKAFECFFSLDKASLLPDHHPDFKVGFDWCGLHVRARVCTCRACWSSLCWICRLHAFVRARMHALLLHGFAFHVLV